jgi:hypothetical protein
VFITSKTARQQDKLTTTQRKELEMMITGTCFATITGTTICVEDSISQIASEPRPSSFQEADDFLAQYGFRRTENWELGKLILSARVESVNNLFNGVRAARFDQAVGTTHEEWQLTPVQDIEIGDLVSDPEASEFYVAAGINANTVETTLLLVEENGVWEERIRHTCSPGTLLMVAHKK